MEHIGKMLPKKTPTGISEVNTDTLYTAKKQSHTENVCTICNGAGFVYPLFADGKTNYSSAIPCQCMQNQGTDRHRKQLETYANLGALRSVSFDKLAPYGCSGDARLQQRFGAAFTAAKKFAAAPSGWLVFIGAVGSGKTHLAAAIASERISCDSVVFFITAADLLDHLRSAFSPDSTQTYDRLFDQVRNAPLLILDDLGVQATTPWAQEKLDQLLTHRFNYELPTVITSEITPDQMEMRLRSRLKNETLCQLFSLDDDINVADYRWREGLELQKNMTFATFDHRRINLPQEQQDNLSHAYDLALGFAKAPDGWVIFQGGTGCGKTHLAAAIVNFRFQAQQAAQFVVVPEFLDQLRSTFSPESKTSYDRLFENIKTTPLLVLDDFGAQNATPWEKEKLYQIINYRYNAQLPMVITTNMRLEEIESRIGSRLADPKMSTPFNITAPDFRTSMVSSVPAKQPYQKHRNSERSK
ncbi:MAG: ATP-binding protein [Dehalococcoidia bacterium]|nr:ATP-binding protein [Dehalococcoidia bacterium]